MKRLFDHNLSFRLVGALASLYPGSMHVRDLAMTTADDQAVWAYAQQHEFAIVSKNTDFYHLSMVRACSHGSTDMHAADSLFRDELKRRGIEYERLEDGRYSLQAADGTQLQVSLENVRRDYDRDEDRDAIVRFVNTVLQTRASARRPSWETVQPFVRYQLEPAEYEEGLDDVVVEPVTDNLLKIYLYASADGTTITWITEADLAEWQVSRQQLAERAEANMQAIVDNTVLESEDIDGVKLGMLSTEETPFKASLILSPAFRNLVSQTHEFPVYVVVPCRDFVYVLSHDNRDFLGHLGPVVIREYEQSSYPITKDVLEVSAEGIRAIGTFAPREGK